MRGVLLCWVLGQIAALSIDSPPNLRKHITTPVLNKFIGDQKHFSITAEAVHVEYGECKHLSEREVAGRVVILTNPGDTPTISKEEANSFCLESAGALVVVRLSKTIYKPGLLYHWTDNRLKHTMSIPLVQAAFRDAVDLVDALDSNTTVIVTVEPDRNPWRDEFFDTTAFLVVRIVLILINTIGVLISLEAAVSHMHRLFIESDPDFLLHDVRPLVSIMAGASVLEVIGCTLRAVYYGMGPFFSSSRLSYMGHMFMIYTPLSLATLPTLLSVSMFLRWGAFGERDTFIKRNLEKFLAFLGGVNIVLTLVFATLLGALVTDSMLWIAMTVEVITVIGCVIAFFSSGRRFIKRLKTSTEMSSKDPKVSKTTKSLHKAVRWILISGVCLCAQVIGTALAITDLVYLPVGHFAVVVTISGAMSLTGVSHALAFRPMAESHRTVAVKLLHIAKLSSLSVLELGRGGRSRAGINAQFSVDQL
eukprot:c1776_g1_i1.p1 GENE.c1776_g1_i1~~c1776_g1_i1.p1  ORF type:complete len:477 (+),score=78.03 c1776_g1_i1:61-1491(+)